MFNKERDTPQIPQQRVCDYKAALWRIQQGNSAMMLFPALMISGHLVTAVADRPPKLDFEPICRESASDSQKVSICIDDERAARDQLTAQWSEFNATDRTRCVRPLTINRSASYVEVLTCLEMERYARKLPKMNGAEFNLLAPEPAEDKTTAPLRSTRPPPPQPQSSPWAGALQVLCLPGLKDILSACSDLP
jgi:hypothetical protein